MCAADVGRSDRHASDPVLAVCRGHTKAAQLTTTFRELGVLPEICDSLERAGITTPFAIQEMTLSVALLGTDLIGQARTGTGKTLAFGIPVLQRSVAPKDPDYVEIPQGKPQALIVAPTRELALQVSGDLALAGADRGLRVLTVYGGVGYDTQLDTLQSGVDIVVGTPGRLIDLANRKVLDLSHVHALVLDEADEMLDLGFLPDVERILRLTPETRQTMLFSATMPAAIVALARTHMRHPMNIRAESSYDTTMVPATAQFIYQAHDLDKPEMIGRILQAEDADKFIVFTRTKRQAQRIADDLAERGFSASPLHGDMAQVAREKALTRSARTSCACSSPPTSPPAASTSRASPTSSTTPAPRTTRPTCTASAAPVARVPPARPSPSSTGPTCTAGR